MRYIVLFVIICLSETASSSDELTKYGERKRLVIAEAEKRISEYGIQIKNIIGIAYCDKDSDCKVLPIGAIPCGGPAGYEVYSAKLDSKKETEITSLAEKGANLRRLLFKLNRTAGFCYYNHPPKLSCKNNICSKLVNNN